MSLADLDIERTCVPSEDWTYWGWDEYPVDFIWEILTYFIDELEGLNYFG